MIGDVKPITKRDLKEAQKLNWEFCGDNTRKRFLELRERLYLLHDKIGNCPFPHPFDYELYESIRFGRWEAFDAMAEADKEFNRYNYGSASIYWMKALKFITEIFKATLEGETPDDIFRNKTMYDNWGEKYKKIEEESQRQWNENYKKSLRGEQ